MTLKLGRILIAAIVAEVVAILALVIIVFIFGPSDPAAAQAYAEKMGLWVGPIAGFITCFLGGWWVAKNLVKDHLINGLALGIAVAIIDLALFLLSGESLMLLIIASNIGRIVAGTLGGWIASQRHLPA